MSDWLSVVLLGLIEGITEFLPVSSTGHLLLAEHWLGERSEVFNVVIQAGAVLAVLAVFRVRATQLISRWREPANLDYLVKIALAFGITAVGGLLLKKAHFALPKTLPPIAWATLVGGILFVVVETWLKRSNRKVSDYVSWPVAIAVAGGQLLAIIFPGASRSGTTILLALVLGLSRSAAVEFSFLLGIPTLLAAAAKEMRDALKEHVPHESWALIGLGTAVAAVAAFLVVHWLLGYVRSRDFRPFGWYRIALGAAILLLVHFGA